MWLIETNSVALAALCREAGAEVLKLGIAPDDHVPAILWSSHGGQEFGRALADVLFGDYDPTGKLPVSWMSSASQQPINSGDGKIPLFGLGAGQQFPATQDPYGIIGASYYDGQRGTQLQRCADSGWGGTGLRAFQSVWTPRTSR